MAVSAPQQHGGGPSWANMAVKKAVHSASTPSVPLVSEGTTAVVDTNAVVALSATQVAALADRLVTLREVVEEARDKRTRAMLESLPVTMHLLEPSEEATAAVTRFARVSGDLHSLSAVDIRLIALAWTLEVAAYGSAHLRVLPPPPRAKARMRNHTKRLPGWGQRGGTWSKMDKLDEDEDAAAAAASSVQPSAANADKIAVETTTAAAAAAVVDPAAAMDESNMSQATSTAPHKPLADGQSDSNGCAVAGAMRLDRQLSGADVSHIADGVQRLDLSRDQDADAASEGESCEGGSDADWEPQRHSLASESDMSQRESSGEDDVINEAEWETAASSRNAQRRKKKKHVQYLQREAEREHAAAEAASQQQADGHEAADSDDDWGSMHSGSVADSSATRASCPRADEDAVLQESTSRICSVTADFSMQNVILQMGLRLAAPDGQQISRLSRWVLRCSACSRICKEAGRLFCPQCGNATMEKVEVTVDAAGQEQYGVRKRHNLRGSRFSLPKPKGGRQNGVAILREDVMLQRMPHMRHGAKDQQIDPYALPSGLQTWSLLESGDSKRASNTPGARHAKGAAAIMASWKHNPNERKHVRTNRRRK